MACTLRSSPQWCLDLSGRSGQQQHRPRTLAACETSTCSHSAHMSPIAATWCPWALAHGRAAQAPITPTNYGVLLDCQFLIRMARCVQGARESAMYYLRNAPSKRRVQMPRMRQHEERHLQRGMCSAADTAFGYMMLATSKFVTMFDVVTPFSVVKAPADPPDHPHIDCTACALTTSPQALTSHATLRACSAIPDSFIDCGAVIFYSNGRTLQQSYWPMCRADAWAALLIPVQHDDLTSVGHRGWLRSIASTQWPTQASAGYGLADNVMPAWRHGPC